MLTSTMDKLAKVNLALREISGNLGEVPVTGNTDFGRIPHRVSKLQPDIKHQLGYPQ